MRSYDVEAEKKCRFVYTEQYLHTKEYHQQTQYALMCFLLS